jgi:SAM-dependent methyltransferase
VTSTLDRYQRIAPFYDLLDLPFEYRRYRKIRPLLFAKLSGLARAERRRPAGAEVELRQMDVTHLDFPDEIFDAAVATFLFCVLPDELQVPALKEIGRVVKRGGAIRLLEYARPLGAVRHALTKIWEPWVGWAYGASFDRRTQEHIPEAGLDLINTRFVVDDLIKLICAARSLK